MEIWRPPVQAPAVRAIKTFLRWRYNNSTVPTKELLRRFLNESAEGAQVSLIAWASYLRKVRRLPSRQIERNLQAVVGFFSYLHEQGKVPWRLEMVWV